MKCAYTKTVHKSDIMLVIQYHKKTSNNLTFNMAHSNMQFS